MPASKSCSQWYLFHSGPGGTGQYSLCLSGRIPSLLGAVLHQALGLAGACLVMGLHHSQLECTVSGRCLELRKWTPQGALQAGACPSGPRLCSVQREGVTLVPAATTQVTANTLSLFCALLWLDFFFPWLLYLPHFTSSSLALVQRPVWSRSLCLLFFSSL